MKTAFGTGAALFADASEAPAFAATSQGVRRFRPMARHAEHAHTARDQIPPRQPS
jgi:hypothetical protein